MIRCVTGESECGECEPCEARTVIRGQVDAIYEIAQALPIDELNARVLLASVTLKLKSLLEES